MSDPLREALELARKFMGHKDTCLSYAVLPLACECDLHKAIEVVEAALAAKPPEQAIFDLQLFYDQLVDGQIIEESDGEPWPLTKSEARQICAALSERLKVVWPLRVAQPATEQPQCCCNASWLGLSIDDCPIHGPKAKAEQPSASQEFDARAECGYCHRALGRHEECYCDEYVRSAVRGAIPATIHSDLLFDNMVELVKAACAAGKREGQHGQ